MLDGVDIGSLWQGVDHNDGIASLPNSDGDVVRCGDSKQGQVGTVGGDDIVRIQRCIGAETALTFLPLAMRRLSSHYPPKLPSDTGSLLYRRLDTPSLISTTQCYSSPRHRVRSPAQRSTSHKSEVGAGGWMWYGAVIAGVGTGLRKSTPYARSKPGGMGRSPTGVWSIQNASQAWFMQIQPSAYMVGHDSVQVSQGRD